MNIVNTLEDSIISYLNNKFKDGSNRRFIVDEDSILLKSENDEQAGIVELTEDFACTFKTVPVYAESVDEISEKFAAGSGKIYREMSVCGSQPLCTLLSLSAGAQSKSSEQAFQKAIADMALYGNTFGIAVTGGDARFNNSGQRNIIANLLTVGLIDKSERLLSSCHCEGNPVYIVGAPDSGNQVQSKAFITRSLYELICDLHDENSIVAVKTIDNGGIVGACATMVIEGVNGIELDAELFEKTFPLHLAESSSTGEPDLMEFIPDKLVMIIRKENCKKLEKTCRKWNIRCMQIGVVIDEHKLTVIKDKKNIVDLHASVLSAFPEKEPENELDFSPATVHVPAAIDIPIPVDEHRDIAKLLINSPNLSSQQWIFEQFDSTVGTNNISTNFISDAVTLKIKGMRHALTVSFCQSATDIAEYPESAKLVVAEALRKVVCTGGVPRVLTGCLNYGGDIDEKILQRVNANIVRFCEKLKIASSGLNFNQNATSGKALINNLSIGVIAFLDDKNQQMTLSFKQKGDMIYMLGISESNLNSSEYIRNYHKVKSSPPQNIDLDNEVKMLEIIDKLISRKFVNSAHTVSRGGLFVALLESAMARSFGFDITCDGEIRKDAFLFGESPSRIIVSVTAAREANFIDFMIKTGVPFMTLGHVTREEIRIDDISYGFINDYRKKYFG